MKEVTIKCDIKLTKIYYPKNTNTVDSGDFAIFMGSVIMPIKNCEVNELIKFKGNVPRLVFGVTYTIIAVLADHHEIYGDTFEIVYMSRKMDISDKESQKELLNTILPEKTVINLFNTYDDVLSLLETRDTAALCKVKGITISNVERLYDTYDNCKDYSEIFVELSKSGLSQNLIKKITDYYKSPEIALNTIRNNPYDLVEIEGIGFKKADEIALKMGFDKFDYRRIKGFLMYTLCEQGEIGKSYIHYSELLKMLYDTLGFVPEDIVTNVAQSMIEDGKIYLSNDYNNIGNMKYYNLEVSICNELNRLMNDEIIPDLDEYVPKTFNVDNVDELIYNVEVEQGFEFTDEQKQAICTCLNNRVVAITGGAGSGKTSSANGICKMFKGYRITAVALSGKAALRITEATGLPASTIHKALGWLQGSFIHDKYNKLETDIVLIDEATMINGSLFEKLLLAIPTGAKVIIMGDVQQLTPIGNCQVFADILNSNVVPTVRLTKLHRQAMESGIIPTSVKVAKQEQLFDTSYQGSEILGDLQDMELNITTEKCDLSDYVVEKFQQEYDKFKNINEVQVISPMKTRGDLSCYNLNCKIQEVYNPVIFNNGSEIIVKLYSNSKSECAYHIRVGDKVINTKNNYNCQNQNGEVTPVFNGNIGIVKNITNNGATIDFIGIGEVWFDKRSCHKLELGYCISIHKSQGSGFKSTIIALDNSSYVMNNSELLYTAITRAKKYCVLIANNSAVRNAIKKKEVKVKQTFLKDLLVQNVICKHSVNS